MEVSTAQLAPLIPLNPLLPLPRPLKPEIQPDPVML